MFKGLIHAADDDTRGLSGSLVKFMRLRRFARIITIRNCFKATIGTIPSQIDKSVGRLTRTRL